jgi:hypothetical protein
MYFKATQEWYSLVLTAQAVKAFGDQCVDFYSVDQV